MAHLASLGGVAPELAVAMATGNTARVHGLDVGRARAGSRRGHRPLSTPRSGRRRRPRSRRSRVGDLPGVSMVLIDGAVMIGRSRNTPPAARAAEIVGGGGPAAGGH